MAFPAIAETLAPTSAYGALPVVPDAAISPDGSKVIVAFNETDRPTVRVYERKAGGELTFLLAAGVGEKISIRGVDFANDKIATVTISQTMDSRKTTAPGWQRFGARLLEYYRTNGPCTPRSTGSGACSRTAKARPAPLPTCSVCFRTESLGFTAPTETWVSMS